MNLSKQLTPNLYVNQIVMIIYCYFVKPQSEIKISIKFYQILTLAS